MLKKWCLKGNSTWVILYYESILTPLFKCPLFSCKQVTFRCIPTSKGILLNYLPPFIYCFIWYFTNETRLFVILTCKPTQPFNWLLQKSLSSGIQNTLSPARITNPEWCQALLFLDGRHTSRSSHMIFLKAETSPRTLKDTLLFCGPLEKKKLVHMLDCLKKHQQQ